MFRMTTTPNPRLLASNETPAACALNPQGRRPAVLVCEHASRRIPAALNGLGLSAEAAVSHAAWDIGALDLSRALAEALDCPLVHSTISRLVYDCNRPPDSAGAMPQTSEVFDIPGNRGLSAPQRAARVHEVYEPFRTLLSETLDTRPEPQVLVTIHSFTPVYNGAPRAVELGLLHDADDRAAHTMLRHATGSGLRVALNEPYSATDGVTHTLREHGIARGIPNVMIEVRNDLIDTPKGLDRIAGILIPILRATVDELTSAGAVQ